MIKFEYGRDFWVSVVHFPSRGWSAEARDGTADLVASVKDAPSAEAALSHIASSLDVCVSEGTDGQ